MDHAALRSNRNTPMVTEFHLPFSAAEGKSDSQSSPERTIPPPVEQAPASSVITQREKKPARPPKKKFQKAGLYSDVFKTDEYVESYEY